MISLVPRRTRRYAAIAAHSQPAAAAPIRTAGRVIAVGAPVSVVPIAVAAIPPAQICPSPPTLTNPARCAMVKPTATSINVAATLSEAPMA